MLSIFTIQLLFQVSSYLMIMNNQVQELYLYQIQNEDQEITIWVRFQTQHILDQDEKYTPFLSINSQISGEQIILKYQYNSLLQIIITVPNQEFTENLISVQNYDRQTWLSIKLLKDQELQWIKAQNKTIQLPEIKYKDRWYYGNLITWQNLTFSLKAFKGSDYTNQLDSFYVQNNPILKLQKQIVMNYKSQIQLEMYLRQQYEDEQLVFIINDQEYNYYLFYGHSNIRIKIKSDFSLNWKQFQGIPHNQWFKLRIHFELDKTITSVNTISDQFEWVYENKQMKPIDGQIPQYYGLIIYLYYMYVEIDNIVIVNNRSQQITNICFPGCKKCEELECLECENNLKLSNQCSCNINQFYDNQIELCKDITEHPGLIQNQKKIQICKLNEYFNTQLEKCIQCPRIDEYYCTDCVFNTELWKVYKTCTFQEIYSGLFLKYFSINYELDQNTFEIIFDKFYTQILNSRCEFQQEVGIIQCKNYAWDHLIYYICDLGQYNQHTHKCQSRKGVFHLFQDRVMCSLFYTQVYLKCIRCPLNCVICIYNQKTIKCIISNQGFYIQPHIYLVKNCIKNTTMCSTNIQNQTLLEDQYLQQNQGDCKLSINQTCLLCVDNYILDQRLECVQGKDLSNAYNFEYFSNGFQQLTHQQLEQLTIGQISIIPEITFQQLLFYGQQYENIKQNYAFINQNKHSYCVKFNQFNQSIKCQLYRQNFTQLSNTNIIYFCPNDKCSYNLTLNIDIYISNSQQIIYRNISFISIQQILDQLMIKFYVQQITFMAYVYVFDSFDQECFDQRIFVLNDSKLELKFPNTYFKLILLFQSYSKFPQCWESKFDSNFQSIQIKDLITNSLLQIEFNSEEIEFINCKFLSKQQISMILHALKVQFKNVTFIHSVYNKRLILIFHETNLIEEIKFLSCNFVDLQIKNEIILIQIQQEVKLFVIYNMTLFEVHISDSIFFKFHKFQILQVELMFLGQTRAYLSNYFSCELLEQNNSFSYFDKINILDSQLLISTFLYTISQVTIQNLQIIDSTILGAQILDIIGRGNFISILFQGLQLEKTKLIQCQAEHDNLILKDIKIIDSYFNQTQSISIKANQINIENIQILNCNYQPALTIFNIYAKIGFIEFFTLENIRIEKKYQQLVVEIPNYLLNFQFQQIRINFIKFENITIDQSKLLHFSYYAAHISNLFIINFQLIGGSLSELILLTEFDQTSMFQLQTISIINFNIKWLQSSKLFYIQGNQGQQKFLDLVIQNITSIQEYQIIFCQNNRAYLKNIYTKFQQFIGFIKQAQSIVKIKNYIQQQHHQLSQLWNTPIFTNLDPKSDYEIISIFNSKFINLVQPIGVYKHNKLVIFHIQKTDIFQFSAFEDIFMFQLYNYTTFNQKGIVFFILIEKVSIYRNIEYKQIFLKCHNSQITLSQLFFNHTSIIILQGKFSGITRIYNIYIQNANMNGYSYFYILNTQSHFYAKNIYVNNQTGNSNVFGFNLFFDIKIQLILHNIFINQCINCKSFIIFNDSNVLGTVYHFHKFIIKSSKFLDELFKINIKNQVQFNIDNLQTYNTSISELVDNSNQQLKYFFNQTSFINVIFVKEIKGNYQFYNSYIQNSTFDGLQVVLINKQMVLNYNQKLFQQPISLSFSEFGVFQSSKIEENLYQVIFNKNQTIAYVPTGIPLSEFRYNNPITYLQESPYHNFIIVLNMQQDQINCSLKQSINDQPGNYSNMNQFELQNGVNIIQNFTFKMNPYLSYPYIQNDITCNNNTIRFNVRTFPCQLGEYLYQNQCQICDITKNYYSVTKRAQLCNIINQDYIESLNVGNIKLRPAFWRAKVDSSKIEQCNNEHCLGGWTPGDQSCSIGYVGALCKECDIYNIRGQGKYAYQNYKCQLCEFNYTIILKGFLVLLWLMFLAFLSFNTNKQITQQYLFFKITQRNVAEILMRQSINQVSIIIKIMTNYIFYLYLFRDKLTFLYQQVNLSFDLISNPTTIIKPHLDCLFVQYDYLRIHYLQYIVIILSPFYTLSIFYLFYLLLLKFRVIQFQFSFILITIYSVYLFNQQLIFQSQIQLLSYNTASNIKWIYMNQQFQYNTKQHYQIMYAFIIPTNLLILLAPMILFVILKSKDKKSLMTTKFYGILFKEYKLQSYYWEILRIYQKYAIITLIYSFNSEYILILIQIFLALLIQNQPYPLKNLNYLEQKSLYILLPTLVDITYMTHHSNYTRGIQFLCLNAILVYDIVMSLIEKAKLQYKDQIMKIKTTLIQKIPISNRFINNEQSERLSQNRIRMKQSYQKIKRSSSFKSIYSQGEVILSSNINTYQISPAEIEMTDIKK